MLTSMYVASILAMQPGPFANVSWSMIADELPAAVGHQHVALVNQLPVTIKMAGPSVILVDFDRVAFGNLMLKPPASAARND